MKIKDCVVKAVGDELWLHHLTSSYKVRMNVETLATLEGLLAKSPSAPLTGDESFLRYKLGEKGLLVDDDDPQGERLSVKRASRLGTLDVELSSKCNLRCGHCFASLSQTNMAPDTLEKVLEGASELEAVSIVFNGGEPLLNPLHRRAVREARGRGLRVVLMTNGTLLDETTAAFLAEQRVAKVVVSLDFFAADHDALRGPGSFERAVAGIRRAVDRGLNVFVTAMTRERNVAHVREFHDYCLGDLGAKGVRFSAVMPIGRGVELDDVGISDESLRSLRAMGLLADEARARPAGLPGRGRFPCSAGVEQVFVGADGSVYACHYFQNVGEQLGTLAVSSLTDIYRSGLSDSIVGRFDQALLSDCAACAGYERCRGGCRARAQLLRGSYSAPDPFACRLYRA